MSQSQVTYILFQTHKLTTYPFVWFENEPQTVLVNSWKSNAELMPRRLHILKICKIKKKTEHSSVFFFYALLHNFYTSFYTNVQDIILLSIIFYHENKDAVVETKRIQLEKWNSKLKLSTVMNPYKLRWY